MSFEAELSPVKPFANLVLTHVGLFLSLVNLTNIIKGLTFYRSMIMSKHSLCSAFLDID